ncbi:pre-rRNA 2'-O-ribose RNA methyltransferase FTSJ3-like [Ruditapes philippinarum]|uniref:pre-rRNA 2'-O-ribose RNA methyltransferase FTSJ3-like n=1 Tax=Ruditapes philippinarum TaxID=129788 RepID=UPI00295AF6D2|nr:pre-rRNA 2'-O-ribose RNA methyltransferase FTSJ3-like [Ruditapes philippinarum]XP_060553528.1 pre-rRNA 2'-O-ribose RNA methyltransferase FTSJ3-like [Ruditapes philippinarum]
MGNKKKVGKQRRDKFYQLAKESGFRARSAFKLIQLNRKFEFLQNSRVVVDLCAAPGGWLQVCSENCPVSSLIIGVDLVGIKPIRNCKTLVDDITTEKCRQDLRKELQTWKADCVLNDGAPNVGKNWVHDAFQQAHLTLQALKLATEFLKKGGWFITKVFRSKDYNSLLWVFQQLFKNVHATKPQASRNESAEIFVVCQNYLAPNRIDPKFLDAKSVFKDIEDEPTQSINLIHPEKQTRHRDGYPEGDYTLFHTLKVSEFITSDNYLELLADASEVKFDDEGIENHPSTTAEIKECLKDIKVLGKREIRLVINWRKKLKKEMEEKRIADMPDEKDAEEKVPEQDSEDDLAALEEQLNDLEGEEKKALKRKIKKTRRERGRLQRKMDMKLVLPGDKLDMSEDRELFDLNRIKSKSQLQKVEEVELSDIDYDEEEEDEVPKKKTKITWERDGIKEYQLPGEGSDGDDGNEDDQGSDDDDDSNEEDADISLDEADLDDLNPLLVGKPGKKAKTDTWFSKDAFAGLEDDDDEDVEIEEMAKAYKEKGGVITGMEEDMIIPEEKVKDINQTKVVKQKVISDDKDSAVEMNSDDSDSETSSESEGNDSDSDSDYDTKEFYKQQEKANKEKKGKAKKSNKSSGFEEVPAEEKSAYKLDTNGLAIGSALVSSRKRRREIIESGYHRYMFNDTNLPDWFEREERKHHRIPLPVTKGEVQEYKMKMKAVDANPIKKIAEAKARKKRKQMKRLQKARKKADAINDTEEVTDREKWQQIKQVYKKAGLLTSKKKEVTYVVSKRGLAGKKVSRPQGVKGPFKVVDGRLKKDSRAQKRSEQRKKGKGKKRR